MTDQEKKNKIYGVDDEYVDKMNSPHVQSEASKNAYAEADKGRENLGNLVNKKEIISNDVKEGMNKTFKTPNSVTQADAWLSSQLKKIQSGKTSYTDDVKAMMDKITNREKFSYDVDSDPLFQQALASAMNSGKQAMQDTIGQASALTGGYGSTYATTAGNQAYNSFIEDAYDNLPQYYQMAMDAYQMEGDELYRQFGMFSEMDDKEYNRNIAAYDATYAHRNQMYNEAYGQFRDEKSDAFAMANLQLNEHGQRVSDATNYHNALMSNAESLYLREYNSWKDQIAQATQMVNLMNSDAWNQSNQDFQATENQKNRDFQATENQKNRDFQASESEKDRAFTASENAKNRASQQSRQSGNGKVVRDGKEYTEATATQKQKARDEYNKGGMEAYEAYIASLPEDTDIDGIDEYVFGYIDEEGNEVKGYGVLPFHAYDFAKDTETHNNLWGWITQADPSDSEDDIDWNDKVTYTDANGKKQTKKLSEIEGDLYDSYKASGMKDEEAEKATNEKLMELTLLRKK